MIDELVALAMGAGKNRSQLWTAIFSLFRVRRMMEIGVWRGEFAAEMLRHVKTLERYYMLDPWRHLDQWHKPFNQSDAVFESAYAATIEATAFAKEKVSVLRGRTTEIIDQVPDTSLDAIYVDGDHTLRGVAIDLLRAWPKIRPGGLLAGDDFLPSIWQHGERFEPSMVFPYAVYFAESVNAPIAALPFGQFLVLKANTGFRFIDPKGQYKNVGLKGQVLRPPNLPAKPLVGS